MMWPQTVLDYMDAGGAPNIHLMVRIEPLNLSTGQITPINYWTGHEFYTASFDGVNRLLTPTFGALKVDNPQYVIGTEIRDLSAGLVGLGREAKNILQAYSTRLKAAEVWQMCFTQGSEYLGARRRWKGTIDQTPQVIGAKGERSSLEIVIVSGMRGGTKTVDAKKSDASYSLRQGDTAMSQASLRDEQSDALGNKA